MEINWKTIQKSTGGKLCQLRSLIAIIIYLNESFQNRTFAHLQPSVRLPFVVNHMKKPAVSYIDQEGTFKLMLKSTFYIFN